MLHDQKLNSKINKIHERDLRIAYKDSDNSFIKLQEKDHSIHYHPLKKPTVTHDRGFQDKKLESTFHEPHL